MSRRYSFTSDDSIALPLSFLVQVLKELVARKVPAGFDHARETAIVEVDFVLDSALASKGKRQPCAAHFDVAIPERREAERSILACVLVVAHPDERLLQQLNDRSEHFLLRQTLTSEIPVGASPYRWKDLCEADQAVVLRLVANFAPAGMISILLPSARVAARCLKMTSRIGTDPDVFPGWRNDE